MTCRVVDRWLQPGADPAAGAPDRGGDALLLRLSANDMARQRRVTFASPAAAAFGAMLAPKDAQVRWVGDSTREATGGQEGAMITSSWSVD